VCRTSSSTTVYTLQQRLQAAQLRRYVLLQKHGVILCPGRSCQHLPFTSIHALTCGRLLCAGQGSAGSVD